MGRFYPQKRQSQMGVTMVEYGLLIALISLAAIATITAVGTQIDTNFQHICQVLNKNEPCDPN